MANPTRSISGSVFAITGGARGIGRATAAAVVREGGRVAVGDVDIDTARATADELGPLASAHEVDVTDRESFARYLDEVEKEIGPLDVLVNNAGIMPLGPFVEESDETAHRQIDINLHGVLYGMKEAIPRMLARSRGHVINIASGAGKAGYPGGATYCATKHAVIGVSDAVRRELRGTGVEMSAVCPAVVKTDLASGVSGTRGIKVSEPEDVADAIVECVKHPKAEVFVPKALGPTTRVLSLLPTRAQDVVAKLIRADTVLSQIDAGRRAAYSERIGGGPQHAALPAGANGEAPAELPPGASVDPAGGDPVGTTTAGAGR